MILDEQGEFFHPWHIQSHPALTGMLTAKSANEQVRGRRFIQHHSGLVEINAWVDVEIIWYGAHFQIEWYSKPETHRSLLK